MSIPWLLSSIAVLAILIGLVAVFAIVRRKKGKELTGPDYRYFFYIGMAYLIIGVALSYLFPGDVPYFNFFVILGVLFTAMGAANIDKWRKK